jgi:hypothetical protein
MDHSIHHKIEVFHQQEKNDSKYNANIKLLVTEYNSLNKCQVKKQTIDEVFKIFCGKPLDEILEHDRMVQMDTILIQKETIEELRSNYWDLRQEYLKLSKK